jgi:hypothetical protein
MNVLLEAIERLTQRELTSSEYPYRATGLVNLEDAIEALSELEVAVRNECECKELFENKFGVYESDGSV